MDVFDKLDTRKIAAAISARRLRRTDRGLWLRDAWQRSATLGGGATGRIKEARLAPLVDAGFVVEGGDGVTWTPEGEAAWEADQQTRHRCSGLTVRYVEPTRVVG